MYFQYCFLLTAAIALFAHDALGPHVGHLAIGAMGENAVLKHAEGGH